MVSGTLSLSWMSLLSVFYLLSSPTLEVPSIHPWGTSSLFQCSPCDPHFQMRKWYSFATKEESRWLKGNFLCSMGHCLLGATARNKKLRGDIKKRDCVDINVIRLREIWFGRVVVVVRDGLSCMVGFVGHQGCFGGLYRFLEEKLHGLVGDKANLLCDKPNLLWPKPNLLWPKPNLLWPKPNLLWPSEIEDILEFNHVLNLAESLWYK